MDSKQHIDNVLVNLRSIFEKTAERIDALKPKEKIPATKLAEEIGKEIGMSGPQLYPTLLFLFKNYPGLEIKKGAHGGLSKLPPDTTSVADPDSTDYTDENGNVNKSESNEEVSV